MSAKRGKYAEEFKRYAVWLTVEQGRPVRETARELGLSASTLRRWTHELGMVPGPVAADAQTVSDPSQAPRAVSQELARPTAETEHLLHELEACTQELTQVRASLAAARREVDELRAKWKDARDRLSIRENEARAREVELPTLVAERDAVRLTWEEQLTEAYQQLATATAERDRMRRECVIRERELAESRQALSRTQLALRSMQATVQAADEKIAGLSGQNAHLQAAQKRQRALTLSSLTGVVALLLVITGQQVWMEGVPLLNERAPSVELLALGARPSGEIEKAGEADMDTAAEQSMPTETEPSGPQSIDLAALEVEPDSESFWLAVIDQSKTDETRDPGPTIGEVAPAADGVEQELSENAVSQDPIWMKAGSAPAETVATTLETPQPPAPKVLGAHYRIQIGAYREQENVEWALREAQKLGIEPIASVPTGRKASPLTAVVVGDFGSVCEACRAQCRLETLGWEGYLRRD